MILHNLYSLPLYELNSLIGTSDEAVWTKVVCYTAYAKWLRF